MPSKKVAKMDIFPDSSDEVSSEHLATRSQSSLKSFFALSPSNRQNNLLLGL
jgi:hypothetical protein